MNFPIPILLIHGLFGSLRDEEILAAFGNHPVYAPDLIGYAANRDACREWTLFDQADYLATLVRERGWTQVDVVGHSVGGAIAVLFADAYPELTRTLVSIEGNFTLKDAFWSGKIAEMQLTEVETMVEEFRADIPGWIKKSVPQPNPWVLKVARNWLFNQPASTIQMQARGVVNATRGSDYLNRISGYLAAGKPLHLVCGERSKDSWDVSAGVKSGARSFRVLDGCGHLMMLESPTQFAEAVLASTVNQTV